MNGRLEKYGSLAARLAIAAIFVHGGWGKLGALDGTAAYIASKGLPAAELGALFAALLEFGGGLAIALGLATRWASLALALFLVPTTWLFHSPIGLEAAAAQVQWIQVYKNLAIAGGLLAFTAFGAGPLALEARRRRPQPSRQLGFRSITQGGES
jgi:putative oxidoreductase